MPRPLNAPKPLPDAYELCKMFSYNPDNGNLTWKKLPCDDPTAARHNGRFAGKVAGSVHKNERSGYVRVMIDGKHYFAHRIIWKMVHGVEPDIIDHANGNGGDNRIENLRNVTFAENLRNKSRYKNNMSGVSGVAFHSRDKVWVARIGIGGKQVHVGSFPTKDEAVAAVYGARIVLNYHPNHGRAAA